MTQVASCPAVPWQSLGVHSQGTLLPGIPVNGLQIPQAGEMESGCKYILLVQGFCNNSYF